MHLSALVSYGQFKHGQNFTHNYQNQVKLVRKLLEQKRYLTVSRGLYSHSDYPMCVRSRFESHALAGVIHKLHYYGQESKRVVMWTPECLDAMTFSMLRIYVLLFAQGNRDLCNACSGGEQSLQNDNALHAGMHL
ncbi:hypothetical protein MTO96_050584 [Rhipicephalus appendiculatus]